MGKQAIFIGFVREADAGNMAPRRERSPQEGNLLPLTLPATLAQWLLRASWMLFLSNLNAALLL